ncbi:DUF4097 family beta strand repeat-containing protein [Aequorivita marisscotiae]|uniref:Adhesin domain-containing protein n=1 Tax=Aequorivita marisscotiae TaxID=3040348 RepID=A0ABY8KZ69_9FLAO|nr:DUF4097 family beta strand repeat-containing protein [Aequorivita sp. Ant34-E75]WGF93365.1 hypothetical protein QCQ61_04035 [Aequorivita sp. Ant34-E75]
MIIEENFSEGKLSLKTGFAPFFVLNNDKLAAHKLMAIEVKLIVPETLSLEIKSKLASVAIDGTIKNLAVSLQRGNCFATNFSGNAHLKTTDGTITVYAADAVGGKAISTRGKIENNLPPNGKFFIEAESINGNIRMLQTK